MLLQWQISIGNLFREIISYKSQKNVKNNHSIKFQARLSYLLVLTINHKREDNSLNGIYSIPMTLLCLDKFYHKGIYLDAFV